MDTIAYSMPSEWWRLLERLPAPGSELDKARDRMLRRFHHFHVGHICTHLSLPSSQHRLHGITAEGLFGSIISPHAEMIRCTLRVKSQVTCFFEYKRSDSVGFYGCRNYTILLYMLERNIQFSAVQRRLAAD
jgi:hypothetical protein